jgi:hypothetical protein
VEASTEMLRILHELEENHLKGLAAVDESWFRDSYFYPSSKMFAPCLTDVLPRTRQAIGTRQTMITLFLTGRKLFVLDILPKGSKFSQLYFAGHVFPDPKRENVNFHRRIPQATFWGHVDNSM